MHPVLGLQHQPNPPEHSCISHSGCCARVMPWSCSAMSTSMPVWHQASPHPSAPVHSQPTLGVLSTVGALSLAFPCLGPGSEPSPAATDPLSSGAIITGSHETGDKPRNSPQPLLMGQLEPSPRERKECLWLGQGASQQGLAGKPIGSPCSGRIPPHLLLSIPALHPSAARQGLLAHQGQGGS